MSYRAIFDAKTTSANSQVVFDFTSDLAPGETVSTATVTAIVHSGVDASPSSIISTKTIASPKVTQVLTGGVEGVTYLLVCVGASSLSKALFQSGFLLVKAPGA